MENKNLGWQSQTFSKERVYFLCTGPDPNGPMPGERLQVVIYNKNNEVIRRLEQIKGTTTDPGYIDFFNSNLCRPMICDYHIIDIDIHGNKSILATHSTPSEANYWLQQNFPSWVHQYCEK